MREDHPIALTLIDSLRSLPVGVFDTYATGQ
jgi:hypothetical protein